MYQIQQLTAAALQDMTIVLADGSSVFLEIYYRPQQYGWFVNTVSYKNFTHQCLRIGNNQNLLHQFRNQIPFGLACYSTSDREPTLQQDFQSGASSLYILTAAEVAEVAAYLAGGAL